MRPARPQRRGQDDGRPHLRDAAAARRGRRARGRARRGARSRAKSGSGSGSPARTTRSTRCLTGRQNLEMFGRLFHLSPRAARRRADELLERFGLADVARKQAKTYSGGMRRRLDLAASFILAPRVLFLDEPTTGQDPRNRNEVWDAIRSFVAEGTTVLLTTHYLDEADQLADQISVIDRGRVIADGTPEELKARVGGSQIDVVVESRGAAGGGRWRSSGSAGRSTRGRRPAPDHRSRARAGRDAGGGAARAGRRRRDGRGRRAAAADARRGVPVADRARRWRHDLGDPRHVDDHAARPDPVGRHAVADRRRAGVPDHVRAAVRLRLRQRHAACRAAATTSSS